MAGLGSAALGVVWAVEAGDHLEVRLVLSGSIALGVAGTGQSQRRRALSVMAAS